MGRRASLALGRKDMGKRWAVLSQPSKSSATRAMSPANVETVRQGYEAFNRGDLEWMIAHLDSEIVWEDAAEVPGSCSYRGTREVRGYLESFAQQWGEIRFEPERILDAGEQVVALVRMVARGRASGAQVDARLAHLYDLREGRGMRVLRVRTFFDRESALEAAGLSE
jgi:uncharacterized protein